MSEASIAGNDRFIQCRTWFHLLDELNVGAFTVDLNRRMIAMNYSAQALMGVREAEVVGLDCREVFSGVPCMVDCLLREDPSGKGGNPEVEIFDENDARHLITRMATPVFAPDGRTTGCLTILQDHSPIADLINRVQYEERSMKIILDNLDVGIFTVNRGGLITFFNRAAEKISGYKRDHVLGEPCATIFEGQNSEDMCLLQDSIRDGSTRSTQRGKMITHGGVVVPIRANYLALRNEKGRIIGGLTTFHDMTLARRLTQAISDRYTFHDMIGKSPSMQHIFERVAVVAGTDATVLIEGATGTGKDLLAKVIHSASGRAERPLVKVNCAAIPDNLLESELFGYIKGAFTGAEKDKPGRFQMADGGTIFLDEIGDMPLSLQAKMLRVLEDREFYPLGGHAIRRVDVRIVSATNRKLEDLVQNGLFRQDLFFRLNVMQIHLPLLKERREDLLLLIPHIVRKLNAVREKTPPGISEAVMELLLNHDYPGNVRELENILEHALIICRGDMIDLTHLPSVLRTRHPEAEPMEPPELTGGERDRIIRMLAKQGGHRGRTARALGIDRSTLWRRMKRMGITAWNR